MFKLKSLVRVVETYKDLIWSAFYEGEKEDVFTQLFKRWTDLEFLTTFIIQNQRYLNNNLYFAGYSVKEVILNAYREARSFRHLFEEYYHNQLNGKHPNLDDRFVLLNKTLDGKDDLKRKMYGHPKDDRQMTSVLRLYAVRVPSKEKNEPLAYIITGGGIKLSNAMPDMKELKKEYPKIELVQSWLNQHKITNKEQLIEYKNNEDQLFNRVGKTIAQN